MFADGMFYNPSGDGDKISIFACSTGHNVMMPWNQRGCDTLWKSD
jgi:hypothetical protein